MAPSPCGNEVGALLYFYYFTELHWSICTWGGICARQLPPAEWKITPAPAYSQIFCTQPAICYVVKSDFFFHGKGKLIAKRDENLFSYWLGGAECQDGGGQLWGKAGRPAAFCLSHALLHRVCDKTSLQEYWANTESLSLGSALFPESTTAKKLHTSNTVFASFSKLNCSFRHQRYGIVMIRNCLFSRWLANMSTA